MIKEAAAFAAKAHEGTFRKGSKVPYICHPMEAALIVALHTSEEEVIAAAYLHDVLEDTAVTAKELNALFGARVCGLVAAETEDKSKSWSERKAATVAHLSSASFEVRLLTLADKLSNMRTTARDYLMTGDAVWERFNEKEKVCHAWYYHGILEALKEFESYPSYRELKDLCEFVFGA